MKKRKREKLNREGFNKKIASCQSPIKMIRNGSRGEQYAELESGQYIRIK